MENIENVILSKDAENVFQNKRKSKVIIIITLFVFSLMSLALILLASQIANIFFNPYQYTSSYSVSEHFEKSVALFRIYGFIIMVVCLSMFAYNYLMGNFQLVFFERYSVKKTEKKLIEKLEDVKVNIDNFKKENITGISDGKENDLLNANEKNIYISVNDKSDITPSIENNLKINDKYINDDFDKSNDRLGQQILQINKSATVNLSVGIFTTLIAILILIISLIFGEQINSIKEVYRIIPRITLTIFIELFSFFFLRLYKKNLDDIRYLYNEQTNIEMKIIALRCALQRDKNDLLKPVVTELSKTERNFVLKKGESTVEIEKQKIEIDEQTKLIEKVGGIIKSMTTQHSK